MVHSLSLVHVSYEHAHSMPSMPERTQRPFNPAMQSLSFLHVLLGSPESQLDGGGVVRHCESLGRWFSGTCWAASPPRPSGGGTRSIAPPSMFVVTTDPPQCATHSAATDTPRRLDRRMVIIALPQSASKGTTVCSPNPS